MDLNVELPDESIEATPPFMVIEPAVIEPKSADIADNCDTLIFPAVIVLAAILFPTIDA